MNFDAISHALVIIFLSGLGILLISAGLMIASMTFRFLSRGFLGNVIVSGFGFGVIIAVISPVVMMAIHILEML